MGKIKQAPADTVTINAKYIFMLIQCESEGWGVGSDFSHII